MGSAGSITECGYDEAGGAEMNTPEPLPVDELLIVKCERLIRKMNRSERKRIHRTLLTEARSASDKLTTDNSNIAATRLTQTDYTSLINICEEQQTDISSFVRKAVVKAMKEHR